MTRRTDSLRVQSPLAGSLRTRRNAYRFAKSMEKFICRCFLLLFAVGVGAFLNVASLRIAQWLAN